MIERHVIRTSDRATFKRCRRQWDWSSYQRQNLRPIVTPKPLHFGIAWHEAMAVYYDPDFWHLPVEDKIESAIARFLKVTAEQKQYFLDVKADLPYDLEEDFNGRVELGVGMLKNYAKWSPLRDKFRPVRVEQEFEVPIMFEGKQLLCPCHGWPVFYRGRLDGIVQDEFNFYWILEHKTASQLNSTDHLDLDEQCGSYAWAMKSLGITVKGVIYNEAVKNVPSPPQELLRPRQGRNFSVNKNQSTTYEMYLDTLLKNNEDVSLYTDMLEYLRVEGPQFFRRTQVHRNTHELQSLGEQIALEALDMLDPNLRIYPNPSRFTCSWCRFREPCVMKNEGSDYEFILKELYAVNKEPDHGDPDGE
jgi:hypothetical protein